ncbi:hypothetical protein BDZ85DRAFT_320598 [Elsinoe ampelina]|uniref:Uncharacterized protein n=1 Tax=Elsinoe ampelina TaxID=302913 RepID=A0A6A6G7P8_9PEZI|nr:hypothetical protein BDZ85DRAFT_320598 [Elsinoe ampelina]
MLTMAIQVINLISDDEAERAHRPAPPSNGLQRQQRPAFQSPRARPLQLERPVKAPTRPIHLDSSSDEDSTSNITNLWGLNETAKRRINPASDTAHTQSDIPKQPGPLPPSHQPQKLINGEYRPPLQHTREPPPAHSVPSADRDASYAIEQQRQSTHSTTSRSIPLTKGVPGLHTASSASAHAGDAAAPLRPFRRTSDSNQMQYVSDTTTHNRATERSIHGPNGSKTSARLPNLGAAPGMQLQQRPVQQPTGIPANRTWMMQGSEAPPSRLQLHQQAQASSLAAQRAIPSKDSPTEPTPRQVGNQTPIEIRMQSNGTTITATRTKYPSDTSRPQIIHSALPMAGQLPAPSPHVIDPQHHSLSPTVRTFRSSQRPKTEMTSPQVTTAMMHGSGAAQADAVINDTHASSDEDSIPARRPRPGTKNDTKVKPQSEAKKDDTKVISQRLDEINSRRPFGVAFDRPAAQKRQRSPSLPPLINTRLDQEDGDYQDEAPEQDIASESSASNSQPSQIQSRPIAEAVSKKRAMPAKFKPGGFQPYSEEDNRLLFQLRKLEVRPWSKIYPYFPDRSQGSLQVHFYTKVQHMKHFGKSDRQVPALVKRTSIREPVHVAPHQDSVPRTIGNPERMEEAPQVPARMSAIKGLRRRATGGSARRAPHVAQEEDPADEQEAQYRLAPEAQFLQSCRHRELGTGNNRSRSAAFTKLAISNIAYTSLGPSKYIDDASGDVATVSWSPNDKFFAGGAVVLSDTNSMQYNRPKNLLLGDHTGTVRELPDHHVQRPLVKKGVNASHSMRESQDPRLFTTVQMVAFSPDNERLHAVSMDGKLSSYLLREGVSETTLEGIYQHDTQVDLLTVSQTNGLIATGERSSTAQSIRILRTNIGDAPRLEHAIGSKNASSGLPMYPSALKWGVAPHQSRYILAGFAQEKQLLYADDDAVDIEGESCLIDCETGHRIDFGYNRNVFDVAWNPQLGHSAFAVASVGFGKLNFGMKTVIRLFGEGQAGLRSHVELECPARDINDVVYSPFDDNILAAGSTDGKVYVWDIRYTKVSQSPHRAFSHGSCLSVLPHERKRWEADTGIRFLSFGATHNRLYSGSSDGIVKAWDPYLSPTNQRMTNIATFPSAIMSGAFNSDSTSLLIGEDRSRLNLLSIGRDDIPLQQAERFSFLPAPEPPPVPEPPTHHHLLSSGQIEYQHHGALPIRQAVQGPNYIPTKTLLTPAEAQLHLRAAAFQRDLFRQRNRWKKMRKAYTGDGPKIKPCDLGCGFLPRGEEGGEVEDSRRAEGRIPGVLTGKAKEGLEAVRAGLVGVCTGCGGRCLPAEKEGEESKCERCGFGCFRCGGEGRVDLVRDVVGCDACGVEWEVGVLGYEVRVNEGMKSGKKSSFGAPAWEREFGDEEREGQLEKVL